MFYGILIRMFPDDHNPPHFHVIYGEYKAIFGIDGEIMEGELPRKQRKLVEAWAAIHEDDLRANWKLAVNGEALFNIEPLR